MALSLRSLLTLSAWCAVAALSPRTAAAQDRITYQDHIRPIFENRCLTCHNPDKKRGDLDLATYGGVMQGGSGGAAVEAGDPAASKLWQVVAHVAEPVMPPKSDKIPQGEIDLIAKWIEGGVLDTASSKARVKKKASVAMTAPGAAQKPEGPPPMPEHLLLDPVVTPARPNAVTAMAHSPWAPLLAVGAPRQVLLFHSTTGELLGVLPFPENGSVETLSFTRNGAMLLAGGGIPGKKGVVVVWEVKTGKEVVRLDTGDEHDVILAADISADLSRVATGGPGRRVRIYDTSTQQCLVTIKKHTDWVTALAFSPDGVLLATGDRNGGLYVWESGSGNEFYTLKGHDKMIASLAWRPDSNVLAAGSEDGNWTWWEMMGGTRIKRTASHGGVLALGFGPDGRLVSGGRDGHARLWDANGNQRRDWTPAGGGMILRALFNHDGTRVVTGSWTGELASWSVEKPDEPPVIFKANPPSIETRLAALDERLAVARPETEQARARLEQAEAAAGEARNKAEEAKRRLAEFRARAERLKERLETTKAEPVSTGGGSPAGAGSDSRDVSGFPEDVRNALRKAVEVRERLDALKQSIAGAAAGIHRNGAEITAKALAVAEEKAAALEKALPEMEQAAAKEEEAVNAARLAAEEARKNLETLDRERRRWLAARENKTVLKLREEALALREKIEELKAEIPALEEETAALTAKMAAVSATADAKEPRQTRAQLESGLKRLEEARGELKTLPQQAEEKQRAADEAWARYLSLLPEPP